MSEKTFPEAARDMSDLSIRIKHMDELGIDIQVIYPTIFIFPTARRAGSRSRDLPQLQPLDGRYRRAKRRTVFAGWSCRRCLTWIASPKN